MLKAKEYCEYSVQ